MDSASLPSLALWLDGIDQWTELAPLLPVLVALELVLSADNAIALAAITRGLSTVEKQRQALNIGILIALVLRIILIFLAEWVLDFWPIQLIAGLYLLSLFISKIREQNSPSEVSSIDQKPNVNSKSLLSTVILLSFTDLAFSLDSVAAAVAISDQVLLVITGGIIGVIALRLTSGLFIGWLEVYTRLELAGYIAVALVGVKLILHLALPTLIISEWVILAFIIILFLWGFSEKQVNIN